MIKPLSIFTLLLATLSYGQYYKEPTCHKECYLSKEFRLSAETADGSKFYTYEYWCACSEKHAFKYLGESKEVRKEFLDPKFNLSSKIITEWVKSEGNVSYYDDEKEIKLKDGYIMSLDMFDCEKRRSKSIMYIIYDADGNVKYTIEDDEYSIKWSTAVPDTVGESILDDVCSRFD